MAVGMGFVRPVVLAVVFLIVLPWLGLTGPSSAAGRPADPTRWGWPLAGSPVVGRFFQPPASTYTSGHRGVDLAGAAGQPVLAAGDGEVSYAGLLAGRGVVVVVHGALRTTYEPVTATVQVGEQVALGAPLGTLEAGHPGCAAAACLHWGLRRGEDYLDPLQFVRRSPGVLLPVPAVGAGGSGGGEAGAGAGTGSEVGPDPHATRCAPAPDASGEEGTWQKIARHGPVSTTAGLALLAGRPRPHPTDAPPDRPGSAAALSVPGRVPAEWPSPAPGPVAGDPVTGRQPTLPGPAPVTTGCSRPVRTDAEVVCLNDERLRRRR